ncbi:MAG: hypothetical protein WCG83_00175 [Candidatus Peregrinibacteria bacterium]
MNNIIQDKTFELLREARDAANVMDTEKALQLMKEAEHLRVFADFQYLNEGGYGADLTLQRPYNETRKQVLSCLSVPAESINDLLRGLQKDIDCALETGNVADPQRYVAMLPDLRLAQAQHEIQSTEWRRYMKAEHAIMFLDALYSAVDIDSVNAQPYLFISPEEQEEDIDHTEEGQNLEDNHELIEANAKIRRIEKMIAALYFLQQKDYFQSMDAAARSGTVRLMCNWISNQIFAIDRIFNTGTAIEGKYREKLEKIRTSFGV